MSRQDTDGDSGTLARTTGTATSETATGHLRERFPRLEIGETARTPVDGIVVVKVGGDYVYLTEDGRHAFVGSLVDLESGANLTEEGKARDEAGNSRRFSGCGPCGVPGTGAGAGCA